MARVAAQKTALPSNHPLHRPLKKRQTEACQRIHALWGVWPWELIIPVAMYEGNAAISNLPTSHYQLEHPPDWSDNILDTLRKLALSTTLDHAVARIGYHAALIKVNRLSVRLTKAVTTECEIEREHTPPNPKAGSGPIVNRRNKKTTMQGRLSQDADMSDLARQRTSSDTSSSPRSSSPQSELGAMSPEAGDYYPRACSDMRPRTALPQFGSSQIGSNSREWLGPLTLPKLHEAGLTYQAMYGSERDSAAFSPTTTGLITPLSEEVNCSGLPFRTGNTQQASHHHSSTQGSNEDPRKRKTSPTIREAMQGLSNVSISQFEGSHQQNITAHTSPEVSSHVHTPRHHTQPHSEEHSKRQKRTALPGFVQLSVPRVELTPPTSPTESSTMTSISTSPAQYSPNAFDSAMAGVRAIQKANNCQRPTYKGFTAPRASHQSQHPQYQTTERHDTLPPIMSSSSSHQRHHSYHTQPQNPSGRPSLQRQLSGSRLPPISSSAGSAMRPVLPARSFSSHHGSLPVCNSSSSSICSGSSSETVTPSTSGSERVTPATAMLGSADQRMKMSFLM